MSGQTPGPWTVRQEIDGMPARRFTRVFGPDDKQIASTYNQTRAHLQNPFDIAEANALVIAAAPDLLEALKGFVEWVSDLGDTMSPATRRLYVDAEAAIAKATWKESAR